MQAIDTARNGMIGAFKAFDGYATRTVQASVDLTNAVSDPTATDAASKTTDGDFVSAFVGQITSRQALAAIVAVVKTADEMLGRVLDIKV